MEQIDKEKAYMENLCICFPADWEQQHKFSHLKKKINYKARSYINKNFVIRRRNSILKVQLGDEFDIRVLQVFVHPLFDANIQLWTKMIFPISGFTLKKQDIEIKG